MNAKKSQVQHASTASKSATDHDQCPVFVDHLPFGDGSAIDINDPEQCSQRWSG